MGCPTSKQALSRDSEEPIKYPHDIVFGASFGDKNT